MQQELYKYSGVGQLYQSDRPVQQIKFVLCHLRVTWF